VIAFWNFDNNTNDRYNNYNGIDLNTSSYAIDYIKLSDTSLKLSAAASQYVEIADPFINLTYRTSIVEI